MKKYLTILFALAIFSNILYGQDTLTKKESKKQQKSFLDTSHPWTIEVPLWIPGFAGSFAYGDVEIEGEDGVGIENPIEPPPTWEWGTLIRRAFSGEWYLKFFFLTRAAYEKGSWLAQFDIISGAVGNSVQFNYNNQEVVKAKIRTINFRLFGGYKIINATSNNNKFRYEFFVYAGVRTYIQSIYSELTGGKLNLDLNPVWVEPIIGIQNQFTFKRWFLVIQGDYGGFVDNSHYSIQLSAFAYYRVGRINSIKFGWNHIDLNRHGKFLRQDYRVNMTLSGPSVGLAFHF